MSVNDSLHLCLQHDRGKLLCLKELAWYSSGLRFVCVREPLVATVQQEKVLISKQIK